MFKRKKQAGPWHWVDGLVLFALGGSFAVVAWAVSGGSALGVAAGIVAGFCYLGAAYWAATEGLDP